MPGEGYDSLLSQGAVKPTVFLTSTFGFRSAAKAGFLRTKRRGKAQTRLALLQDRGDLLHWQTLLENDRD